MKIRALGVAVLNEQRYQGTSEEADGADKAARIEGVEDETANPMHLCLSVANAPPNKLWKKVKRPQKSYFE